ncbi:hypothetical protein C9374_002965 [Naegleria lovaniensis]|uniref:Uncharacterized protein n=1 Tax=Naegleria lovaniensis TaxID=51637 RepID=A0AA88GPA7_NAELO|nr:uncharacterized protein C9374_002965 [Naegleria lovaniensis]KAG2385816.1 hypothetical protein C9374_002965 [Naegleria lovaniensis]
MKKTSRSESSLSPDVPSSSDDEDENDLTMASPSEKSKNSSGQSQTCLTSTCPTLNLKIPSHFLYESIILSTKFSSSKPFQPSKLLFVFRAVACVWSLVTILLYQLVYIQQGHLTFLSFLTNVSFVVFTAYFTLQTVLGLVHYFMIHWRKGELTPLLSFSVSNVMWFLSELTITASILVCIGFWSLASFEQYKPLRIDCYFNFSVHGIVGIFALFEFLLSNISFRFWHVFMIAMYPTAFFLWLQILAETRLITLFPYSMSNYFKFPFTSSVIYTFGMPFVFILTFCILCYFSKLRRLHVMTQKH